MLLFVTEPAHPPATTRALARLVVAAGGLVMLRDKRPAWDRALREELAGPSLIVNVGAESASVAGGCRGWHAPEAVWRALGEAPYGLCSVADHEGSGVAFAEAQRVPLALVSPIFVDKGRQARGLAAFSGPSPVARLALGGIISGHEAELVARAGARGVAVQRALYAAHDPARLVAELLAPFRA